MTKCELQNFPCIGTVYSKFDNLCAEELRKLFTANDIINKSSYCTTIPISKDLQLDELETSDYLKSLHGKMGLYHLWVDYDDCDDHEMYTMECVYVGKGFAQHRIDSHIKDKFLNKDSLYVSFFECRNRFAKYLEQLFLDLYKFDLNKAENHGEDTLYAVWDESRHHYGTQLHEISNIHAKKIGLGPYED